MRHYYLYQMYFPKIMVQYWCSTYKVFILWTTEPEQPNCEIGSMERTKIVIVSNSRLGKLVNCYRKHRRKPRENTVGGSKSGKKFQFWELAALGITQIMLKCRWHQLVYLVKKLSQYFQKDGRRSWFLMCETEIPWILSSYFFKTEISISSNSVRLKSRKGAIFGSLTWNYSNNYIW